ncbi:hypothetical protein LUZ60_011250 [Juncus effusus]|nr:hypothetical protein LUZ60_011250 [Juncus effusus]
MASFPNQILQSQISNGQIDPFLGFVDSARSTLSSSSSSAVACGDSDGDGQMPWGWAVSRILKTCVAYPSGVTAAILLSDLFQAWNEQRKYLTAKRKPEVMNLLKKSQRRARLNNTVSIDSIYEKNFISVSSAIEAVVLDTFLLPGTDIYMLCLGDMWSSCTIDLYLHRRYYEYVGANGTLKKGREIFLTGCTLRIGTGGPGKSRLLPTEYLVILLDEDQDDDAMLLGAQFCTYSFSSISNDKSASYSFLARIEKIEGLEPLRSIERKQITLVDNEGDKIEFLLWGEQVLLASLFSVGSMLAIDRPFISNFVNTNNTEELCLEYGSATLIYLLPFVHKEEQLVLASTQMRTQELKSSQVSLPRNSHGQIDFTKYPFRPYIVDLGDKMAGISLYGIVTEISRERKSNGVETVFCLGLEDETGSVILKLHFTSSWSLGRVGVGHTVYISSLSCHKNPQRTLEVSWFEKEAGSSFINISCLPALLNSSCLHNLSLLSHLTPQTETTQICCVNLDQVHNIHAILCHHPCGESASQISHDLYSCQFCHCEFDYNKCSYSFQLQIAVKDESGEIFASCIGQTASELLQISPDEFLNLPEDERAMYLYTLQDESFMVALVNCKRRGEKLSEDQFANWEITRAQRCE